MNRSRQRCGPHCGPTQPRLSLMAALPVVLAAGLCGTIQAEYIDGFEQGYRFWANRGGGNTHVEIINGELHLGVPADGVATIGYLCSHAIPQSEPLVFSVDVVSMGSTTWRVGMWCEFDRGAEGAPSGGYGVFRMIDSLRIAKWWTDSSGQFGGIWLAEASMPALRAPETMRLRLMCQGDSLQMVGESVLRTNGKMLASVPFLDTPGVDPTLALAVNDNGAPFLHPPRNLACDTYGTAAGPGSAVIDNLVCSHPPLPPDLAIACTIDHQAKVTWDGSAVLLESSSPQGPWAPCIAEVGNVENRCTSRTSLLGAQRFFQVQPGRHFSVGSQSYIEWRTAKAVAGAPGGFLHLRPWLGHAVIHGTDLGEGDYLLRRDVTGVWWRDCVASVDIVAQDTTVEEGVALGIVLRAKPQAGFWLIEEEGLPEKHYVGRLTFKQPGNPLESALSITGPGGEVLQETPLPAVDLVSDYRLRFWAVGSHLRAELFDFADLANPVATCEASDERSPTGIEALCLTARPNGRTQIMFDNFCLWGVWTPAEW